MKKMEKRLRRMACIGLLLLVVICSYAGSAQPAVQAVSVPVTLQAVPETALTAQPISQVVERLADEREKVLSKLQDIAAQPGADEKTIEKIMGEKAEFIRRMETEAEICALLQGMGFADTAVVIGETGAVSIIAPWQIAENEQNRLRMIDAAAYHAGVAPDSVKIILSKK